MGGLEPPTHLFHRPLYQLSYTVRFIIIHVPILVSPVNHFQTVIRYATF